MVALFASVELHLIGPSPCMQLSLAFLRRSQHGAIRDRQRKLSKSIQVVCVDDFLKQRLVDGNPGIFVENIPESWAPNRALVDHV